MSDLIVIAIIVLIAGAAIGFIVRQKKRGVKCIGCSGCSCGSEGGCNMQCLGCNFQSK